MCWKYGSPEMYTSTCPMCEIYKPLGTRCPHRKDTCKKKDNHPKFEVLHFRNAEVSTFNGCGYCRWADIKPGSPNSGWPGCCRPPTSAEIALIPAADWPAVNFVHRTPIPPEVKAALRDAEVGLASKGRASPSLQTAPLNITPKNPAVRDSPTVGRTMSGCRDGAATRVVSGPIPLAKTRSGGSGHSPRSPPDVQNPTVPARRSEPTAPTSLTSPSSTLHTPARRLSISSIMSGTSLSPKPSSSQHAPKSPPNVATSLARTLSSVRSPARPADNALLSDSSSSSSGRSRSGNGNSSDSAGSATDGTETSIGFTDYLSDESEAELQRQAEIKAMQIAEKNAEETEFKAARQQLADVGLRPPKVWNPGRSGGQTVAIVSRD